MGREKSCFSDKLDSEDRRELSNSEFGLPDERAYPMPDAEHVRAAESYFRNCPDEKKPVLARNILKKAGEFGVKVESAVILDWASR